MSNSASDLNFARKSSIRLSSIDVKQRTYEDDGVARFLKPLLIYLKCLGVPWAIDSHEKQPPQRHLTNFFIRLMGWLLFAANVGSFMYYVVLQSSYMDEKTTVTLTIIIILGNELFLKVINHLSLLFLTRSARQIRLFQIIRHLSYPGLKIKQVSGIMLFIFLLVCKL